MQLQPMGLWRPGVYELWHVGHQGGSIWRARLPLAHCACPYSGLEHRELGVTVILFCNCHVLPWLWISIREALEAQGIYRFETPYQGSDSITQSELMRMMNDNSKDEEIQVGNYSSYIPTESVHGPGHA